MKISFTSDLHIEFRDIQLTNTDNSDILVLAGDICVASQLFEKEDPMLGSPASERIHKFFLECSNQFKHIIYVGGNHEHYRSDLYESMPILKTHLSYIPNLHILDNESIEIDDVTFVGSTLWADANKRDPSTLYVLNKAMNDFRIIGNGETVFTPRDMVAEFDKNLAYLTEALSDNSKQYVVVTHHGVSERCVSAEFKDDYHVNGGYRSILDQFIMDRPQAKAWVIGHSHSPLDTLIGETRVLRNPRGYPTEKCFETFELKSFEVK